MRSPLAALLLTISAGMPVRSSPAICAAFDLRLLMMIEFAGEHGTVDPETLRETVERMAVARRYCRTGRAAEALQLYESADLGGPTALLR